MSKNPFEGVAPNLKYHYLFMLTKKYPNHDGRHHHRQARSQRISDTENRKFLDFITQNVAEDDWRIALSGSKLLHLWTASNDWELILKLSEAFPNHTSGIIDRHVR